jgi:Ser/Thr protein kinase RdoA (MazF antagonist)
MRAKHFEALGELLGSLQNHGISFKPPARFTRPQFGALRLATRLAALRSAAKDKLLTPAQLSFFERAFELAFRSMKSLGHGRDVFGLIHGDLGYGNYLFYRGQAGAIDFEAGGFGYFLEDLVEPIHFAQHVPHFPRLCADVLRGYRRQRPLDAKMESHLPAFLCCAAVTTAGYIAAEPSRRNDLPEFAKYFSRNLPRDVPFLASRRS